MRLIYTWPIIDDSLSRRDLRREGLDEYKHFAHAAGFRVIGRPAVLFPRQPMAQGCGSVRRWRVDATEKWLERNQDRVWLLTVLARGIEKRFGDTPALQAKRRAEIA